MFATDAILATLMSCTRSVYSWDIVVQRVGSKLFFDKRDNSDFGKKPVWEQQKGVGCCAGSRQVPGTREWAGNVSPQALTVVAAFPPPPTCSGTWRREGLSLQYVLEAPTF